MADIPRHAGLRRIERIRAVWLSSVSHCGFSTGVGAGKLPPESISNLNEWIVGLQLRMIDMSELDSRPPRYRVRWTPVETGGIRTPVPAPANLRSQQATQQTGRQTISSSERYSPYNGISRSNRPSNLNVQENKDFEYSVTQYYS